MARGVNKVFLVGNVGKDPQYRDASNNGVATISLATSEIWKDNNGEQQGKTEWHRVVAFGRHAGVMRDYVKKGMQLFIEGRIQTREWTDDHNVKRYITEIVVRDLHMLGNSSNAGQSQTDGAYDEAQQTASSGNDSEAAMNEGGQPNSGNARSINGYNGKNGANGRLPTAGDDWADQIPF